MPPHIEALEEINAGYAAGPKFKKNPKKLPTLLGGDPEVFLKNKLNGKIVPSVGLIGGSKGKGVELFGGCKWLEDNVTVEFNFQPQRTGEGFYEIVHMLNKYGNHELGKKDLEIVPTCVHKFNKQDLLTQEANVFGCDPDFCAYDINNEANTVSPSAIGNFRFCGGHLHLGFENKENIPSFAFAILADCYIGLPSVSYDAQGLRRGYYGQAGKYRPKPYGLEYRTMSNWWMRPEHDASMFRMAKEAMCLTARFQDSIDELGRIFDKMPIKDVQIAINEEDKKACKILWDQASSYAIESGIFLGRTFYPRNASERN